MVSGQCSIVDTLHVYGSDKAELVKSQGKAAGVQGSCLHFLGSKLGYQYTISLKDDLMMMQYYFQGIYTFQRHGSF